MDHRTERRYLFSHQWVSNAEKKDKERFKKGVPWNGSKDWHTQSEAVEIQIAYNKATLNKMVKDH